MASAPPTNPVVMIIGATGTGKSKVSMGRFVQPLAYPNRFRAAGSGTCNTVQWRDHQL